MKAQELKVVMYHYVRDLEHSRYPDIKGLNLKEFSGQISYLQRNYQIIRMEQLLAAVSGKEQLPENAALLTFDDGYTDHFDYVFPILDERGLQGSFYIPAKTFVEHTLLDVNKIHFILASAPYTELYSELLRKLDEYRGGEWEYPSNEKLVETFAKPNRFDPAEIIFIKRILQNGIPEKLRHIISSELFEKYVGISEENFARELYMSEAQIGCMHRHGMHIGVHGYDHYWLGKLSKPQMQEDLTKALKYLKPFIDMDAWTMNYPYGSEGAYNDDVIAFLKENGCALAFTTEAKPVRLGESERYLLPRFDTRDFPVE